MEKTLQNNNENAKLSDFVESIEYIPVDLGGNYIYGLILHGYDEKEELFFLGDLYSLYAVQKNGKLKNKIGRKG